MRNLLRENYQQAFSITNKYGCNTEGGIALWDLPARIACAFNPIVFTRTRYYFRTDGYEPTQRIKPNYVRRNGESSIGLMYKADQAIYVRVETSTGIQILTISKGSISVAASAWIIRVLSIGLSATSVLSSTSKSAEYIYVAEGTPYEDSSFLCSDSGVVMYVVNDIDTSYLDLYTDNNEVGTKLSAESFKGVTLFDVSAVVRLWFNERLDDIADSPVADRRLFTRFTVKGIGGTGTSYDFIALNAVAQIGERSDRTDDVGCVLTEFKRLNLYNGFPLDYSILNEGSGSSAAGDFDESGVFRVRVDGTELTLLSEATDDTQVQTEASNPILIMKRFDINVFPSCNPSRPFYVRWINMLGGVDYFMFCRQQKRQPTVKSVDTYNTRAINPYEARSNNHAYNITTENKVVVGAEGVANGDYTPLSKLPFAPTIEWFNEATGRWIALTVSKFDGSYDTKDETHDIEITFSLPDINTQF